MELKNRHQKPDAFFQIDEDDLTPYEGRIVATWHTHTHTSANLSGDDYRLFLQYPDWLHYIAVEKDVRCYSVRNNKVLIHEEADL